jgi:hypothetical protein
MVRGESRFPALPPDHHQEPVSALPIAPRATFTGVVTTASVTDGLRDLPALRAAALNGSLFLASVLAGRLDTPAAPATAVAVVAVVSIGCRLPTAYAVLTGLTAWACLTGFVVNGLGQLTFAGPDLARLVVLLGASALASELPSRARGQSQPTRRNTAYRTAPTTTMSRIAKG